MDDAILLKEQDATHAAAVADYPPFTKITLQLIMHTKALLAIFNSVPCQSS
jgi:hypothetical protein